MISCLVFMTVLAFAIAVLFGAGVESVNFGPFDVFDNPPSPPFSADFNHTGSASTPRLMSLLFYAAGTPVFVVGIWFLAATTVKRLHDRDKSGWWIVLFFVAPALLGRMATRLGDFSIATDVLAFVAFGLNFWGFVELLLLKGTPGPNRFGADPRAPVSTGVRWEQQSELEFVAYSAGPSPESHVKRGHD